MELPGAPCKKKSWVKCWSSDEQSTHWRSEEESREIGENRLDVEFVCATDDRPSRSWRKWIVRAIDREKLFPVYLLFSRSSNRGNFIELLRWNGTTDLIAASLLDDSAKNATYLSPTIQNELISLLGEQLRQCICNKVSNLLSTKRLDDFVFSDAW